MKGRKMTAKERLLKVEESAVERRAIFGRLLRHLSAGYSIDCFAELSQKAVERCLCVYKDEFCREELEEALRRGKQSWEQIGSRQASGECLGNSRSWYYNMANRYGWRDKLDLQAEHKGSVAINVVSYASAKEPVKTQESDISSDQ